MQQNALRCTYFEVKSRETCREKYWESWKYLPFGKQLIKVKIQKNFVT